MNTDKRFLAAPTLQNATSNGRPPARKSAALHLDASPQILAAYARNGRFTCHMMKQGESIVRSKLPGLESVVAAFQNHHKNTREGS